MLGLKELKCLVPGHTFLQYDAGFGVTGRLSSLHSWTEGRTDKKKYNQSYFQCHRTEGDKTKHLCNMNVFTRQTLTIAKQKVEKWKVFQFINVTGIIKS